MIYCAQMAVLLEYSFSGGRMKVEDSIISSSCSSSEAEGHDMHELFCFHLNDDETFDLDTQEFYDKVSSTSTPSAVRSSELQQRNGYDTDDSGFCENLVSDAELLQMSNLHLRDESYCESSTNSRQSDTFPLPKLCLLSQFDDYCENEVQSDADARSASSERCELATKRAEIVETVPAERSSVRRQRSPDAVVQRCSRSRLSLDSFSESHFEHSRPVRRSSDSFVPIHSADEVFADLLPPALDHPLQASLPPPALDDIVQADPSSTPVADVPLCHTLSPAVADIPHDILLEPSLSADQSFGPPPPADRIFDPSPVADVDAVFKESLQSILSEFAPPYLDRLIGRKMGLDHVDIISELYERSLSLIIRQICHYLTDTDLRR